MPHLRGDLDFLLLDPNSLRIYAKYIDNRAKAACSDDLGSVRGSILGYIRNTPEYMNATTINPIHTLKTECGWYNIAISRLLCPQDRLAEFDADPEAFCASVCNGEANFKITADDHPLLLYNNTLADPNDPMAGLMCSDLLKMAYQSLWTGPSSVGKKPGHTEKICGRPSIASTYGITQVEPRTIAYVAVLVQFALNSQTQWSRVHIDFDSAEWYKQLLEPFKSPSWAKKMLEW
ncbi:hypothetical protein BD413DRAFT_701279 [Trametes elegans]|nr:hypothetical protein BD413DRAFT_701279 [Trametes elegans]